MLVLIQTPEGGGGWPGRDIQGEGRRTKMRRTIAAKAKKRPGTAAPAAIVKSEWVVRES